MLQRIALALSSFSTGTTSIMVGVKSVLVAATAVVLSSLLPTAQATTFDQKCASFATGIKNATLVSHAVVTAGSNITNTLIPASCGSQTTQVSSDFCRLVLDLATSSRSSTYMELWLPRNWTGRFLATGNGGIGGCIQYSDMDYTSSQGFATSGSNNGHWGMNGTLFLNNIEVVTDFSWRALRTSASVGKELTKSFYGKAHKKSYYLGCSTGGRQGFKIAQDFPEEFDGIVAGAPAFSFNNLTSWSGWFHGLIVQAGADGYPPSSTWSALDAELLRQCDALDGAADGIIEEPSLCTFKPETLICGTSNSSTCITGKQAATVRKVFSDLHGVNGDFVYPRLQPAPGLIASTYGIYAASQFLYTDHWFKYAIYNNPNLDTSILTPEQWAYAYNLNPADISTWKGDLSPIRSRGSKILHYHGQADNIITSANSNEYYQHVSQTMGLPPAKLDEFYRLFRISGMAHCSGGNGAWNIGNRLGGYSSLDPSENVLSAVVRWVEQGVAPETITGARFVNGSASLGVDYKRAHCRYPYRNVYKGSGSVKDPANWQCVL
ncbi:Tannase/feruloyl esterase [Bisporella sp. PMI_857]|nr:Tannase/feruloyl esterase [Bisporella sp. PMI_857]